ncbi:hypothetical protein [Streptomyces sp. NPDC057253]|uniref:hypothetical protein n=1 Tax=Streptomyces sp. NPDC057253 TaxID=3346069 RepID=UPI00363522A8
MGRLRAHEELILVERRVFGLMDEDAAACPHPWPAGPRPADVSVHAQYGRIDFTTGAPDHRAAVRLEAWDGVPGVPEGSWEDDERVALVLPSGRVQLWTLTMGPGRAVFEVGGPGAYEVQTWARGRDTALELNWRAQPVPDGTERYVVQFWPSSDEGAAAGV